MDWMSCKGWTVHEPVGAVSVYHDVYCPHGQAVDVINIGKRPIQQDDLVSWVKEYGEDYRRNICNYHMR